MPKKKIKVLSLFDGMSCGQIALNRAGFEVESYSASEIDKHAISAAMANYPNTIQLGDVTLVSALDVDNIDLLIGGSPCQGFSFAGKQLNFEDPRSKLFFEFVRLLEETKPKYFLLENVKMNQESKDVISKYLGVEPIEINSALVSAQNRKRLYWTNIPNVTQPEDLGILLQDIIEEGKVDRAKSYCIDANYAKGGSPKQYFEKSRRQLVFDTNGTKHAPNVWRAPYFEPYRISRPTKLSADKFPCLRSKAGSRTGGVAVEREDGFWRKLTPVECERLQTVPDGYTAKGGASNTQRYKMLGNGWTVDVIAHILKNMKL